jgi:replication-associated recombination protein RarA
MKYDIKTVNGYDFFECSSAMQKSIRRGMEDEAMFWAVELFNSGFVEYVWKRLKIISSEDIGLANETISSEIQALYEMHKELAKKKEDKNQPWRLMLTHAVLKLCRSAKSRTVDWALMYYWGCHQFRQRPVPDVALDKHNDRGKKMGRGWKHFFDEGTHLVSNPIPITEDEYRELAKKWAGNNCDGGLFG